MTKAIAWFTSTLLLTVLNAVTFKFFWAWYVVSVFHFLPLVTVTQAVALMVFLNLFTRVSYAEIEARQRAFTSSFREAVPYLSLALTWAFAGLFHLYLIWFR